jgi:hypothetical protein
MSGTQTAGFDLVMQFSEEAYEELLGVFFDESGILGSIVDLIPGVESNEFTIDVSLDRPTDVTLPADAENPVDIRLGIGVGGSLASLRMVVGITVDRSESDHDKVQLDFESSIYYAEVTVGGVHVPIPNLIGRLSDIIPSIPILPVPVNRTSTSPTDITRVDFKIVDDTTAADFDATAAMFTFGGGTAGNATALQRFVPAGQRGAIGIFFSWLCRMAVPRLESSLDLPAGSFDIGADSCSLNRSVDMGDATLTRLVLSLQDGFIGVSARVTKSGFCYDASGDVSARMRLAITGGRLVASVEIDDPDVDVDIPWYCWLAGAVIGAVIGGVLLGVIGAIVGAVLVPLITWIASEVIEGTIEEVAQRITDAINDAVPDVDVPAFGVNILFQEVFIDDVVVTASFDVESHAPIRSQGTLTLANNFGVDLDSGKVVVAAAPEADVRWVGERDGRKLETGCQAALARTGTTDFAGLARYQLYAFAYGTPSAVLLFELGLPNPFGGLFGGLFGDAFFENQRVFAVRTNEGRFAIVQVTEIESSYLRLRYKTFERSALSVQITGDFKCVREFVAPIDAGVVFEPAKRAVAAAASPAAGPLSLVSRVSAARPAEKGCDEDKPHGGGGQQEPGRPTEPPCDRTTPLAPPHDGRWVSHFFGKQLAQARLDAVTSGVSGTAEFLWLIGGDRLEGASGKKTVNGVEVSYSVSGSHLVLTVAASAQIELFVTVQVVDEHGCSASASTCVHHEGRCRTRVRYIPGFRQFQTLQTIPEASLGTVSLAKASAREPVRYLPLEG